MSPARPSLLFVYANDAGAIPGLIHYVHKIVSPSTYECRLCALTHGPLGRRAAWKRALDELSIPCEFLHRDELLARHQVRDPALPVVFVVREGRLGPLISKSEIEACGDLDAIIALLQERTRTIARETAPAAQRDG
jgi:hypothetical protein